MSARSFYVAASSSPEGVKAARALASRLEGMGMRWRFDWTSGPGAPREQWEGLAYEDVRAAVECDVFVLIPEPPSPGACVEWGARLGAHRPAYVIGPHGHQFFGSHPLVRRVADVDELLAALAHEERDDA